MEWIAEAILRIFTGVLVIVTTARFCADGAAPETTFAASALMLLVLAAVSAATGGRGDFLMYRSAPRSSHRRRRLSWPADISEPPAAARDRSASPAFQTQANLGFVSAGANAAGTAFFAHVRFRMGVAAAMVLARSGRRQDQCTPAT